MQHASKGRSAPWYKEWFGREEYKLVYKHRDHREAEQCVDLIEKAVSPAPGAQVLDVGCGRGRHALMLAGRGYRVTGIDLSAESLEEARRRARKEGLALIFQQQDMREPVCNACFDGAVNLFTAFGYFMEDDDHAHALDAIVSALRAGGWFVQDFLNAPFVEKTIEPHDRRIENGITIEQRRWIENGRINKEIRIERGKTSRTFHESVRLLTLYDFQTLYERADLRLLHTFGHYDGRAYSSASPRLIMIARRA